MLVFIILGMIYVTSLFGYVMIIDGEMDQFMTTDIFDYQMCLATHPDNSVEGSTLEFMFGIIWLCIAIFNWPVIMLFDLYVFKYLKY